MSGVSADYQKAAELYERFYAREADSDYDKQAPIIWPDKQAIYARATALGYRSDKWTSPGDYQDYIHHHENPLPWIVHQANPGDTLLKRPFAKPRTMHFGFLGYMLDLEFIDPKTGRIRHIDWKHLEKKPFLGQDLTRNLLVILPQDGGYPLLIWSRILEVTERGIEN